MKTAVSIINHDRLGSAVHCTCVGNADEPGQTRYVAQGCDWGYAVTEQMALQQPAGSIGIQTNTPAAVPPDINKAAFSSAPAPSNLSAEDDIRISDFPILAWSEAKPR